MPARKGFPCPALVLGALLTAATLLVSACDDTKPGLYQDYIGAELARDAATRPAASSGPATAPAVPSHIPATGPLALTVQESILLALENNRLLAVDRFNPRIQRTAEQVERALFDPTITGGYSGTRAKDRHDQNPSLDSLSNSTTGNLGASIFLPTGTTLDIVGETTRRWNEGAADEHDTRVGFDIKQPLLRGAGLDVNLASLREARIDTATSEYVLRDVAQQLVSDVEKTYWNYALALRQIDIYTSSLNLAQQELDETKERIQIGKLAETELAAAQAAVALRREDLINARSTVAKTRLQLIRLLSPPRENLWDIEIVNVNMPVVPAIKLDDVARHVEVALRMRPDLNEARLAIQKGDVEIVRTRNGLLPKLDAFITMGRSGYAGSFGRSVDRMIDGGSYDAAAGVSLEVSPINREARANYQSAQLKRQQSAESLANIEQLAQVDVRSAYVEVLRTAEQVTATAATRVSQEEKYRAETEKFRVGKSTSLLVSQAQSDLVTSQINEVQALVSYTNAMVEMFRIEGSLLERRGIVAPGDKPVVMSEPVWKK